MSRTYTFYLAVLDGAICVFFVIRGFFLGDFFVHSRTVRLDVMQGFLIGVGLAFVTAQAFARIKATKINGAQLRPGIEDKLTPNGQVPTHNNVMDMVSGLLQNLGEAL